MADLTSELVLLLPERRRFSGQAVSPAFGKLLARADTLERPAGEREQLLRHFDLLPRGWPMAAITRQFDVGDADRATWLRADPVHMQPDISGVRLMAWGNIGLSADEAEEFLQPLRPVFGDAGFPLDAPSPERWYLRLSHEAPFPAFSTPAEGLGESLLAHLPAGAEATRWRTLLNEAQVILHNHPRNRQRQARGQLPVNSVWFWGGGRLPDSIRSPVTAVISEDPELLALARMCAAGVAPRDEGGTLIDLRSSRDWTALERGPVGEACAGWKRRYGALQLDFSDGSGFRLAPGQQWRLLRPAIDRLAF